MTNDPDKTDEIAALVARGAAALAINSVTLAQGYLGRAVNAGGAAQVLKLAADYAHEATLLFEPVEYAAPVRNGFAVLALITPLDTPPPGMRYTLGMLHMMQAGIDEEDPQLTEKQQQSAAHESYVKAAALFLAEAADGHDIFAPLARLHLIEFHEFGLGGFTEDAGQAAALRRALATNPAVVAYQRKLGADTEARLKALPGLDRPSPVLPKLFDLNRWDISQLRPC